MKIVAIAGSLRKNSYNKLLLQNVIKLIPDHIDFQIYDISSIPLYNQDLETNMPKEVVKFKDEVKSADAILISTPEYNYSVPGVMKNVIDWGSRPYGNNSWEGKPLAIMGASIGGFGTVRAQMNLRQVCVYVNMTPLNKPEVYVSYAEKAFNANGELNDESTKDKIREMIGALVQAVKKKSC